MRSIAHSPARTIVTCPKSRASTHSSPPPSAPKNKEAVLGRLCFWSSPTQCRQPRAQKTKDGLARTMGFEAEAASSSSIYRCNQRYGRVAALGRAAQRTDGGGLFPCGARTFGRRAHTQTVQTECMGVCTGGFYRTCSIFHIVTCTIGHSFLLIRLRRTLFISRH